MRNPIPASSLLIIFYRNPEAGKVKTRLAATLGNQKALSVYLHLVAHTIAVTKPLPVDKVVFYSDHIDEEDQWSADHFQKQKQEGKELGERMALAFQHGFRQGYRTICIIGTDCLELTPEIMVEAFTHLAHQDAVIGPAADGGYYLLGLRIFNPDIFNEKQWSSSTVLQHTLNDFKRLGWTSYKLPVLRDIDEASDLPEGFAVT